jgi:hypothetical protein
LTIDIFASTFNGLKGNDDVEHCSLARYHKNNVFFFDIRDERLSKPDNLHCSADYIDHLARSGAAGKNVASNLLNFSDVADQILLFCMSGTDLTTQALKAKIVSFEFK